MFYFCVPGNTPAEFLFSGQFRSGPNGSVHSDRCINSFVLLLGTSGTMPIAVGERRYLLREGTYLLLPKGIRHFGTARSSPGQSHDWCHFDLPDGWSLSEKAPDDRTILVIPEFGELPHSEQIRILFRQLADTACRREMDPIRRSENCNAYLRILLNEIAEQTAVRTDDEQTLRRRATAERVREWIRTHATDEIRPHTVADVFGYHVDYLTRLFRLASGMSVGAYIIACRIEAAKDLLMRTDLPVRTIAHRVGFSDEKYFMKVFRRAEQTTPTEYRNAYFRLHVNYK